MAFGTMQDALTTAGTEGNWLADEDIEFWQKVMSSLESFEQAIKGNRKDQAEDVGR